MVSTPCSGCFRKFSQILPIKMSYCLDCDMDIGDVEEDAYKKGFELGSSVQPEYKNGEMILSLGKPEGYKEVFLYSCFQKFEIQSQEMVLDQEIKKRCYTESFLNGYENGMKSIREIQRNHEKILKELEMEFVKRKSAVYLFYYVENSKMDKKMFDYNLISLIKKFIV